LDAHTRNWSAVAPETVALSDPLTTGAPDLGGFWIIAAADLDMALKLAAEGSRPALSSALRHRQNR